MDENKERKTIDFLEAQKRKKSKQAALRRKKLLIWAAIAAAVLLVGLFLFLQVAEVFAGQSFWQNFQA